MLHVLIEKLDEWGMCLKVAAFFSVAFLDNPNEKKKNSANEAQYVGLQAVLLVYGIIALSYPWKKT